MYPRHVPPADIPTKAPAYGIYAHEVAGLLAFKNNIELTTSAGDGRPVVAYDEVNLVRETGLDPGYWVYDRTGEATEMLQELHWTLDASEVAGGQVDNTSDGGAAFDGSTIGAVQVGVPGQVGQAVRFDGNSHIVVGDDRTPAFQVNRNSGLDMALKLWFRRDEGTDALQRLLSTGVGGLNDAGWMVANGPDSLVLSIDDGQGHTVTKVVNAPGLGEEWSFLAVNFHVDGEFAEVFIDGTLRGTLDYANLEDFFSNAHALHLGVNAASFIDATGDAVADRITQVYQLQRYVTACAGRGEFPIKFNGSIFTMQGPAETPHRRSGSPTIFTPDYRRWGGGYWFQNTRLNYWPMLAAGDTEMMHPWFEMHRRAAPLCRHRVRKHLGLDGLFFPETMTIWGTWLNGGFRENRPEDLRLAFHPNRFTRRYWQGSLELSTVMLEYLDHTGDEGWWNEVAYPIVRDAVAFYRSYYYRRDEDGKVLFEPSQSLETWHVARNPTPDIAGLRHVLGQLLALPESAVPADDRAGFEAYLAELPEVPVEQYDERFPGRLLPAEKYDDLRNMENCELYAVFPYPLGALGGELYEQAQSAWPVRRMRAVVGWMQDAVHAAMLGLAEEAAEAIAAAFVPDDIFEPHLKYRWSAPQDPAIRFPAFFGPNFDWVPDQDHGTVNCLALQKMCLQTQHGRLRVLPAWPGRWDVHFRLHAPGRTVVECQVRAGKITALTVTPEARQADVVQPQEVG